MKIAVILSNSGGELDRVDIEISANASDEDIDDALQDAIEGWLLGVGDTIQIVELQS